VLVAVPLWRLGYWLSGVFESFDGFIGFVTTQVAIGGAAMFIARRSGGTAPAVLVLGSYLGLNLYPLMFGGTGYVAWALLGMVTTLSLIVVPTVAGGAGLLTRRIGSNTGGAVCRLPVCSMALIGPRGVARIVDVTVAVG